MHKNRAYKKALFCWDFGAGADIGIGVVRVAVVAIDLAIIVIEVDVRDIAIGIQRAHIA